MPQGAGVATVFARWDEAVGESVAAHVRPDRLQGDTLVVIADHPAWATQLRHLAPVVLAQLAEACGGNSGVNALEVRVRRGS
jgi:predicted nucleic acid-binding Zn ribbon protein